MIGQTQPQKLPGALCTLFTSALLTKMYGPSPDCKRFEVVRKDSSRKCIRPLSGESLSGHLMMIRTRRSL